ncbi:MAG: mechanosensitive ion channel family protein [Reichenbachiella sp.]
MRLLLLALALIVSLASKAQIQKDTISSRLQSPYQALQTFASNTNTNGSNLTAASIIFNNPSLEPEDRVSYAKKYEQILEGAGIIIFFDEVPKDPDFFDSLSNAYRYVVNDRYPEIYLEKKRGRWQFQPEVMVQMDSVHKELYKFGTNLFISKEIKETTLGGTFLYLKYWQWLGLIIFVTGLLLIRYIFLLVFERLIAKFLLKIGQDGISEKYIIPIARPAGMIIVFMMIGVFYPVLQLPRMIGFYAVLIIKAAIPLYSMIILYRIVSILEVYLLKMLSNSKNSLDDQLVPLIKKILRILIIIIGALIILDNLDVPILPLLTGLSIGGLAFALAAQDTIKNFFGSMMIFIDKPFQIGDWIMANGIDGTVEEVGFRSTRIRTFRNSVISVPNGALADQTIDNNGLRMLRRFKTTIAITYDTPPDRIEVFVEGLKRIVSHHPSASDEKMEIHLNDMGASSLDIMFYIFFHAKGWSAELKYRQEIILSILRLGEQLSVHFAFPTQTVHVENLPGQGSLSPNYTLTKEDLDKRLDEYLKPLA